MRSYIGTYRVFAPIDERTGKSTTNINDTYLLGNIKFNATAKILKLWLYTSLLVTMQPILSYHYLIL